MAHYRWRKAADGGTEMVPFDDVESFNPKRFEKPDIENLSPSLVPDTTGIRCTVDGCNRVFKKSMIMARHFSLSHKDKYVDRDSWRNYFETVGITQTGDQT